MKKHSMEFWLVLILAQVFGCVLVGAIGWLAGFSIDAIVFGCLLGFSFGIWQGSR